MMSTSMTSYDRVNQTQCRLTNMTKYDRVCLVNGVLTIMSNNDENEYMPRVCHLIKVQISSLKFTTLS